MGKKLQFCEDSSSSEDDEKELPGNLGIESQFSELKSATSTVLSLSKQKMNSNHKSKNMPILSCFEVRKLSLEVIPKSEISSQV
jgi:hypothetical protein